MNPFLRSLPSFYLACLLAALALAAGAWRALWRTDAREMDEIGRVL